MKKISLILCVLSGLLMALLSTSCDTNPKKDFVPTGSHDINLLFSTNKVFIGDVFNVDLDVYHPNEEVVGETSGNLSTNVVLRNRSRYTETFNHTTALTRISYELSSYELGTFPAFSGDIQTTTTNGTVREISIPVNELIVPSILDEDRKTISQWVDLTQTNQSEAISQILEIRDVLEPKAEWPKWLPVALLIIGLALLIAWLTAKFWSKPKEEAPPPPPPPAHLIALERFQALKESGLIDEGQHDAFYVEVSAIVRGYLENRFDLHAPEQTTEEFIRDVSRNTVLTMDQQQRTIVFLEQCDLVKFAKFEPGKAEMEQVLDAGVTFVTETMQREEIAEPEAAV